MTTSIGAFEAKNQLSELLRRVQDGEEIVITKHGRPLARLCGWNEGADGEDVRKAFGQLRDLRRGVVSGRAKGESFAHFVHEGHQW